ncbi:MAG: hypothetical protein K0R39_3190 [Symbiobacteriaceae bacterium]|nr:hypothetical protein [Symbiobacteriaceae bacterium]
MRSRFAADERGNIYVEALIAVAVLAVGLMPIFGGWSLSAGARAQTARQNAALAVARAHMEPLHRYSALAWDEMPPQVTLQDPANPGFTITRTAAPRSGQAGLKDVTVTVAWVDARGKAQSVALATAVARRP